MLFCPSKTQASQYIQHVKNKITYGRGNNNVFKSVLHIFHEGNRELIAHIIYNA
jgi:hypothetical protein